MNKTWWTIDRIVMLIGLVVMLFGWGTTTGVLTSKVSSLESDLDKKDQEIEKLKDENNDQEIKISLNADAVSDIADILTELNRRAREE